MVVHGMQIPVRGQHRKDIWKYCSGLVQTDVRGTNILARLLQTQTVLEWARANGCPERTGWGVSHGLLGIEK